MGWFSGYDKYNENFSYSLTPAYLWGADGNIFAMAMQKYLKGETTLTDIAKAGIATPSLKTKTMVKYMFTPEYLQSVNKLNIDDDTAFNPDKLMSAPQYDESFIGPLPKGYSNISKYRNNYIINTKASTEKLHSLIQNKVAPYANSNTFIAYKLKHVSIDDIPNDTYYAFTSLYGKDVVINKNLTINERTNTNTGIVDHYEIYFSGFIAVDGKITPFSKIYSHVYPEAYADVIASLMSVFPPMIKIIPAAHDIFYNPHTCLDKESTKYNLNVTPSLSSYDRKISFITDVIIFGDEITELNNSTNNSIPNPEEEKESDIWKSNIENAPMIPALPIQSLLIKHDFSDSNKKIYIKACNKGFGIKSWKSLYRQNMEADKDYSHDFDMYFGHVQLGFYHNDILVPELAQYAFEFAKRLFMNSNVIGEPAVLTVESTVTEGHNGHQKTETASTIKNETHIRNWYGNFPGYPDIYEELTYASAEYMLCYCPNFSKEYAAYQQLYHYGENDDETLYCIWYVHKLSNTLVEVIKIYGLNTHVMSMYSLNFEPHATPTHYASLGRTFSSDSFYTQLDNDGIYLPYIPEIMQKLPYKAERFCVGKCIVSLNFAYALMIEHVKWYNTGFGRFVLTAVKIVIMVIACMTLQWYIAAAVVVAGVISILEQYGLQSSFLSKVKLGASIFAAVFSVANVAVNIWEAASSTTSNMGNVTTTATTGSSAGSSVGSFADNANFSGSFNLSGVNTANDFQYTNIAGPSIGAGATSPALTAMDILKLGNEIIKSFQKGYEIYSEYKQNSVTKAIAGIYDDMSAMNMEYALKMNEITYNLHHMNDTQEKNKLYVRYLKTCFNSPYHFDECMYTGLDIDVMYDNTIRTELDNKYEIENSLLFA